MPRPTARSPHGQPSAPQPSAPRPSTPRPHTLRPDAAQPASGLADPAGRPPVVEHVEGVARRLRAALRRALDEAIPPPRRMTSLREGLGLDKSLASRVHRAAAAVEPLQSLAFGPGVPGYRLLLERLAAKSAGARARAALAAAVDALEQAHSLFPDGRRGFEAALVKWTPEHLDRSARRARQQIYQGMLFLMGVEIDVAYQAYAYLPGPRPDRCDLATVELRQDIGRARPGGREILSGVPYVIPAPGEPPPETFETLDGRPLAVSAAGAASAADALLADCCSQPIPPLTTVPRGGSLLLVASGETPAVGARMTTALGVVGRNLIPLARSPEVPYLQNLLVFRKPIRLLIIDVLAPPALGLGAPLLTVSGASGGGAPATPEADDIAAMTPPSTFRLLGDFAAGSMDALADPEARRVPELLTRLLGAARPRPGPDDRFRAYRLRVEFPVPHARHLIWLGLPEGAARTNPPPTQPAPTDRRSRPGRG